MDTQNTSRQLRYLEEVRIPLHRAGFGTLPVEGEQLPVLWNGAPLCRITGKGSVFYRREDADTPQAEDALYRVEDIAAKTLEYMTAMEAAPQLKASGLDGDYRILADFGGTVLAGSPSKYGVQFVTWDWDYDRTGVVHGHYFMENYDAAKQDFATRSGLIQKEQLFSPEQLTEIYRCCTDSVNEDFFELTDKQVELIHSVQQRLRYACRIWTSASVSRRTHWNEPRRSRQCNTTWQRPVKQFSVTPATRNTVWRLSHAVCFMPQRSGRQRDGFPDGWADIPNASDSARYKALGNSVAIPCVEFIMSRIAAALL